MQVLKLRKRTHNFGAVHKFSFRIFISIRGNFQLMSLPITRHPPLQLNIIPLDLLFFLIIKLFYVWRWSRQK